VDLPHLIRTGRFAFHELLGGQNIKNWSATKIDSPHFTQLSREILEYTATDRYQGLMTDLFFALTT